MKIYYLVTDNNKPSWGVGIIYHHVSILVKYGYEASIVHNKIGFVLEWLDLDVPILYFQNIKFNKEDLLIVPEVMASAYDYRKLKCRKILFVQGLSYLFYDFKVGLTHKIQGFEQAIIIMPHMYNVVKKYTGLEVQLIPPFIADYFYKKIEYLHEREKIVLIFPKNQQSEYSLIRHILLSDGILAPNTFMNRHFTDKWRLIEIQGLTHKETAQLMHKAAFMVTTNTFEAFNTSVPEAMAAGCINICYEAIGPADFLKSGENAFVFDNNKAIALAEKVLVLTKEYDNLKKDLIEIRQLGRQTAEQYMYHIMEESLISYYEQY